MVSLIPSRQAKHQALARLRDEFGEFFEQFISHWPAPFDTDYGLDRLWGLNVEDRADEVVVRAEVPGFEVDDLDVRFSAGLLTIRAEPKRESQGTGNGHGKDGSHRPFQRRVRVPYRIDTDRIQASYRNGVLEVHLPKVQEAKASRICVGA